MDNLLEIMAHWFGRDHDAVVIMAAKPGFSGARAWQIRCCNQAWALRKWPASAGPASRLESICRFQHTIAGADVPVAKPRSSPQGNFVIDARGALWGLSTWMPGAADYHAHPSVAKLEAALSMLARIHLAAARVDHGCGGRLPGVGISPALVHRGQLLEQLAGGGAGELSACIGGQSPRILLARETLGLTLQLAPQLLDAARYWSLARLPLQWRLTDVWHDHILFVGEQVSGVIDFDAAAIDVAAGDVARLLGSLVGSDQKSWSVGLAAYQQIRQLSAEERALLPYLDASGVLLSAANWLRWLFGPRGAFPADYDSDRAFARVVELRNRLKVLLASHL